MKQNSGNIKILVVCPSLAGFYSSDELPVGRAEGSLYREVPSGALAFVDLLSRRADSVVILHIGYTQSLDPTGQSNHR